MCVPACVLEREMVGRFCFFSQHLSFHGSVIVMCVSVLDERQDSQFKVEL